jgi:hypothetical protein
MSAAAWLRLAAAPTFGVMALLTGIGGPVEMLCSATTASPLSGMVPMYLLMAAFHSGPWLKVISRQRSGVQDTPNCAVRAGDFSRSRLLHSRSSNILAGPPADS